jgi:hypothetical protein
MYTIAESSPHIRIYFRVTLVHRVQQPRLNIEDKTMNLRLLLEERKLLEICNVFFNSRVRTGVHNESQ